MTILSKHHIGYTITKTTFLLFHIYVYEMIACIIMHITHYIEFLKLFVFIIFFFPGYI